MVSHCYVMLRYVTLLAIRKLKLCYALNSSDYAAVVKYVSVF